jgi:UDP-N-acetylmuramoyl-L-alanyl-D-glutamate--2,6-diaminopimelate ligase
VIHFGKEGSAMKRLSALWANDKLFDECIIVGNIHQRVQSITINSKKCTTDSIFVAQKGLHVDGHTFIDEAISQGASTIVHSEPLPNYQDKVTYIHHPHPASVASLLAHNLYGPYPEHIIGVTGTDGKSTTCEFLYRILTSCGITCGLLSTISIADGLTYAPSPYRQSTPEVEILYPFLHRCYQNGVTIVILESTSHALSTKTSRLAHIKYSGAIITNITSEHLDFHHTIETYIDDKMNIVRQLKSGAPLVLRTSFAHGEATPIVELDTNQIQKYSFDEECSDCVVHGRTQQLNIDYREIRIGDEESGGTFNFAFAPNVYSFNLLAALTLARCFVKRPLTEMMVEEDINRSITGRYQLLYHRHTYPIVIDFAHTKNSFERLFSFIREIDPTVHIVAIFGAAGERDRSKRPHLGKVAARYCHKIYLTNEDPRQENPERIIADIQKGIDQGSPVTVEVILDRTQAIDKAVKNIKENELLVVLGKGHEKTIEGYDTIEPYNEWECISQAINTYSRE